MTPRRAARLVPLCLVGVFLVACGSSLVQSPPKQAIAFARRYSLALLVQNDCKAARRMESARGIGCQFDTSFEGSFPHHVAQLSFDPGSLAFNKRCHDVLTGARENESCVTLTMVGYDGRGNWSLGTLEIYLEEHHKTLWVTNVAYGDGASCNTPEFKCPDEEEIWADRATA